MPGVTLQMAQAKGDGDRWSAEIALGEDLEGWRVLAGFVVRDESLTLAELRVFPGPHVTDELERELGVWSDDELDKDSNGITARLLRRVPIGEISRFAHRDFVAVAKSQLIVTPPRWARAAARQPAQPGRAGRGDDFYLVWATRYVHATARGGSPIVELSKKHKTKPTRVRDLVHEARRRDLLTPGVQGRAGGSLTNKAKELLRKAEQYG